MKEATMLSLVLLVLTAMVVAGHPYSPYTDSKDGVMKNTQQLSDEEVAAYLKRKMDREKLDPATIMDYVQSLIQGGKKPPPTTTVTPERNCIPNSVKEDSLQIAQLKTILDTIHPVTGDSLPNLTLVTPDHFVTVYDDEFDPANSYSVMLNADETITHIWTNYAPCFSCVQSLLTEYDKPELEKPTIHVGRLLNDSASQDLNKVIRALQCLAKLSHSGFEIRAWNIDDFKAPGGSNFFTDTCNTEIDTYNHDSGFTSALSNLIRHVDFINELGDSSHANTWCTT